MRVVVTGASGRLGAYLLNPLRERGWTILPWSGASHGLWGGSPLISIDLANEHAIKSALVQADPDAVLHLAAIASAEEVRRDPKRARLVNVDATRHIAGWCAEHGRRLIFTSTDMVFDGRGSLYAESDEPRPILAYGATKREAEIEALNAPNSVIARVSLLYGPTRCGRPNFFDHSIARLRAGEPQSFFDDEHRSPLDFQSAAEVLAALVSSDFRGILHVGGRERLSRFELMSRSATALGLDPALIQASSRADVAFNEPRPADVSLNTHLLARLLPNLERPGVEEAIQRMSVGWREAGANHPSPPGRSGCVESQGFFLHAGVISLHGDWSLIMVFRTTRSLRMHATTTTLPCFPFSRSRSAKRLMGGLNRMALRVAM